MPVALIGLSVLAALIIVAPALRLGPLAPVSAQTAAQPLTERGILYPDSPSVRRVAAQRLSAAQREALQARLYQVRKRVALQSGPVPVRQAPRLAVPTAPALKIGVASRVHGNPADFSIARNIQNPQANVAGQSTLAEPAAANNGAHIFAAGNFDHSEFSTNGGTTWTDVPIPAGPADAPIVCCDNDIVFDDARRVLFHMVLYINGGVTNGVIRIFVYRAFNQAANCSYTIDQAGTNNNILMDYPHIGLSSGFLFLATNDINTSTGAQVARMRRFDLDDLTDCAAAAFTVYGWPSNIEGQRVVVPGEGSNTAFSMYWAINDNSTTIRLFRWRDVDALPTNVTRTVNATTFANPNPPTDADCRGGTGNRNYIDDVTAGIYGFNLRTAYGRGRVAVFWQALPDGSHMQAFARGAVFRLDPLPDDATWNPILISQPDLFNNTFCIAIPSVTSNKRGDFGFTLAAGGQAGGGGTAAQGYVAISDDFSDAGIPGFPGSIVITAAGTENRTDERYGDYFTIHPWEPCEKFFNATNYALNGLTVADVNSRYIEFGRNRDYRCWSNWANRRPIPQP